MRKTTRGGVGVVVWGQKVLLPAKNMRLLLIAQRP